MTMQRQGLARYALVTMADREQAQAAIIEVNGRIFMNRPLIVRLVCGPESSHPAPTSEVIAPKRFKKREKRSAILASAAEGRRLYIGNLALETTEAELETFFCGHGVESTAIPVNQGTKHAGGYAFVNLKSADKAQNAIVELSGKDILGRKVAVRLARKPERIEICEDGHSDELPNTSAPQHVLYNRAPVFVTFWTNEMDDCLRNVVVMAKNSAFNLKLKHSVPKHQAATEGRGDLNVPIKVRPWFATANDARRQPGKAPLSFVLSDAGDDW